MTKKNKHIQRGKHKIIIMIIFVIILFLSSNVNAVTYYVDFAAGNNSNSGTSTALPWKNIPGTCTVVSSNAATCTYVSTWNGVKINANDIVKLKSGTTHNSSVGGEIRFTSTYYATGATQGSPITLIRDTTWGSGPVTIDGSGITLPGNGWGLVHTQVGGLKLDGVTENGLIIQNSGVIGVSVYGSSNIVGAFIYHTKFFNNGTAVPDDSNAASAGDIKFDDVTGGVIQHCYLDGNGQHINGIVMGETGSKKANGVLVDNVVISNHTCGDAEAGDWAIGIKTLSSVATVSNCTIYNNFKGADNGDKNNSFSPILKYINNNIYNNVESGLNFNGGTAVGISPTLTAYVINNIIRNNGLRGSYIYDGKMNIYVVGNVYDNNGTPSFPYDSWNINVSNNVSPTETSTIRTYLYNNIFYKPATAQNVAVSYWRRAATSTDHNWYSDYNSYVQGASEYFASWGMMSPSDETYNFSYGANGPGHASGNWYNYYGSSVNAPAGGVLGHYHQDVHSKGTGADNTALPPFTDRANHDYTLTSSYSGTNLSSQPWYIPEMGLDRTGIARKNWDIGPYEYIGMSGNKYPFPPSNLQIY